ncbi:MAG: hypothetical protein AAGF11_52420 [Myxococcota bacterium]
MATHATESSACMLANDEVPTSLVLPLDPVGRPSPVCSQCIVVTTKPPANDTATLSFTFAGEQGEGFDGHAIISVRLVDRTILELDELALSLDDQQTYTFTLDEEGFDWLDVDRVLFELTNS